MSASFSLDALLAPEPDALEALSDGEPGAWQPLLEALVKGDTPPAPRGFVDALLARADVDRWSQIAWDATAEMKSAHFAAGLTPKKKFEEWFRAGVLAHRPENDPNALLARIGELQRAPGDDVRDKARALVDDLARLAPDSELHFQAAAILAARCIEEGAWPEAATAAEEAATIVGRMPAEAKLLLRLESIDPAAITTRLRAAALVGQGELTQGFELLESVYDGPAAPVLHTKRLIVGDDPVQGALQELAFHVQVARPGDAEWLEVLRRAADTFEDDAPEHAEAVFAMLERSLPRTAPAPAPEPVRPPSSPLHTAIHQLIEALRSRELLTLEPDFSLDKTTNALIDALEHARSDSTAAAVAAVADALIEAPGVDDLFADDATLEKLLHEVFGKVGRT